MPVKVPTAHAGSPSRHAQLPNTVCCKGHHGTEGRKGVIQLGAAGWGGIGGGDGVRGVGGCREV